MGESLVILEINCLHFDPPVLWSEGETYHGLHPIMPAGMGRPESLIAYMVANVSPKEGELRLAKKIYIRAPTPRHGISVSPLLPPPALSPMMTIFFGSTGAIPEFAGGSIRYK